MSENTVLVKREPMELSFQDMLSLADVMAKSGRFPSDRTQAQALVKILAGREVGVGPFASMTGISIVGGKPVFGYDLIGAIVKGSGKYDYRVNRLDDECCEIEFFEYKSGEWVSIGVSKFDQEDARKAESGKLVAPGHKGSMLERFPRNMLIARAMANGRRWLCPDASMGIPMYAPGEIDAIDIDFTPVSTTTGSFTETVEEQIVRLHAAGQQVEAIASQVGRPVAYVNGVIENISSENEQEGGDGGGELADNA